MYGTKALHLACVEKTQYFIDLKTHEHKSDIKASIERQHVYTKARAKRGTPEKRLTHTANAHCRPRRGFYGWVSRAAKNSTCSRTNRTISASCFPAQVQKDQPPDSVFQTSVRRPDMIKEYVKINGQEANVSTSLGNEQRCKGTTNHWPGNEDVLRVAGQMLVVTLTCILGVTYSPLFVSYRSVRARLVGVSLTQVARSCRNMSRVLTEVMAAVKHSQSPILH